MCGTSVKCYDLICIWSQSSQKEIRKNRKYGAFINLYVWSNKSKSIIDGLGI
jgi:hypothetical protein